MEKCMWPKCSENGIVFGLCEEHFRSVMYPLYEEKAVYETGKRNMAKCLDCNDVIESHYRHDFVSCSCGNISVDGGKDYTKRSFYNSNWEDMSEGF